MDAEGGPAGDPGAGAGGSGAAAGPPRADPAYIQMFLLKCGPCMGLRAPKRSGTIIREEWQLFRAHTCRNTKLQGS